MNLLNNNGREPWESFETSISPWRVQVLPIRQRAAVPFFVWCFIVRNSGFGNLDVSILKNSRIESASRLPSISGKQPTGESNASASVLACAEAAREPLGESEKPSPLVLPMVGAAAIVNYWGSVQPGAEANRSIGDRR